MKKKGQKEEKKIKMKKKGQKEEKEKKEKKGSRVQFKCFR